MASIFDPLTFDQLRTNALDAIEANAGVTPDTSDGSLVKALVEAHTANDTFLQSQIQHVARNRYLDTSVGADVDAYVGQFVPPFTPRQEAIKATSIPLPPTTLTKAAQTGVLAVTLATGFLPGQALRLVSGSYLATAKVRATNSVNPTTALRANAANGATSIQIDSIEGIVNGTQLKLSYDGYEVVVTAASAAGNTVNLTGPLVTGHTFVYNGTNPAPTVVTKLNVVLIEGLTFVSGVLANFGVGATVAATDMLAGAKFSRYGSDATTPSIEVGYKIQTNESAIEFEVIEDATNQWWDAGTSKYKMRANENYMHVPIRALVAGPQVLNADTLVVMPNPVTGIDTVTNPVSITNGAAAESDESVKRRFRAFIAGLSVATPPALDAAIEAVQSDLIFTLIENVENDGVTTSRGRFIVIASDSGGVLSAELKRALEDAIKLARPTCSVFAVLPPTLVVPAIVIEYQLSAGYNATSVTEAVQLAVFSSFSGTTPGATLLFNKLFDVIFNTPGVENVTKLTVGGNGYSLPRSGSYTVIGQGPKNITAGPLELLRPPLSGISVTVVE